MTDIERRLLENQLVLFDALSLLFIKEPSPNDPMETISLYYNRRRDVINNIYTARCGTTQVLNTQGDNVND